MAARGLAGDPSPQRFFLDRPDFLGITAAQDNLIFVNRNEVTPGALMMEALFAEAFHLLGFGDRELWVASGIVAPPGITPGDNMTYSQLFHEGISKACGLLD